MEAYDDHKIFSDEKLRSSLPPPTPNNQVEELAWSDKKEKVNILITFGTMVSLPFLLKALRL